MITRLFRIDGGYEWRVAREDERLYSRDAEGFVAIPIAHLKAGLRFPMHKFMYSLFKDHFCCPLSQVSPNAIRTILWYIAACTKDGRQPTFKGFFILFYVRVTGAKPFYEVHLNHANAVGRQLGEFVPFKFPKGMADWQEEFIMVRGGDLAFLPNFAKEVKPEYRVDRKGPNETVVTNLVRTMRSLGETWSEKNFYENATLMQHNCKLLVW